MSDSVSNNSTRRPEILLDMIETVAVVHSEKSFCVTFDGKKLKRGLTKTSGDVDLLEFETCPSLQDRIDQLEKQKKKLEIISCEFCNEEETTNIADFSQQYREEIKRLLREQIKEMSLNVIHARELRKKKPYGKEKLIEKRGGSD